MAKWVKALWLELEVPVSNPIGAWPGLGTQPCYKAPCDVWVEIVKLQWLTLGWWGCPLVNAPKLAVGQAQIAVKKGSCAGFEKLGFLMHESLHSSKQVQENDNAL